MLIVDVLTDVKFVLLHEGKNDDGIRGFFMDVWELFIKVSVCVVPGEMLLLMKVRHN